MYAPGEPRGPFVDNVSALFVAHTLAILPNPCLGLVPVLG
jgi:hypothetical protein